MFARFLAAFCLVLIPAFAGSTDDTEPNLAVYLKTSPLQPSLPLQWMQRELSQIMLHAGYAIEWRDTRSPQDYGEVANLAVVELRGVCGLRANGDPPTETVQDGESLASTPVMSGHILPFSTVNCGAVSRLLAPALDIDSGAHADFIYGRALARIIAHELYHVLSGRNEHDHEGIAKAGFTLRDLLNDRFEFEAITLARLKPAPAAAGSTATDAAPARQF
jgi:hypothetical protein